MSIEERFEESRNFFNNEEYDKAVPLFEALANEGHAGAQYMLGICYFSGKGIAKDDAKAFKWLRISAEQGYEDAKKMLAEVNADGTGCGCLGVPFLGGLNFGGRIGAIYGVILSLVTFVDILFKGNPAGNIIFYATIFIIVFSVLGHVIWLLEIRLKIHKSRGGKLGAIIGVGTTILILVIDALINGLSLTRLPTVMFGFLILVVLFGVIFSVVGHSIGWIVKKTQKNK
jgi:hypothetical protein